MFHLHFVWNVSLGHGRQPLVDAASKQMKEMAFCSSYNGSSNPPAIELAERLSDICYPQINNFYFTSGGGESTDSNFKLARYYWKAKGKPEKNRLRFANTDIENHDSRYTTGQKSGG